MTPDSSRFARFARFTQGSWKTEPLPPPLPSRHLQDREGTKGEPGSPKSDARGQASCLPLRWALGDNCGGSPDPPPWLGMDSGILPPNPFPLFAAPQALTKHPAIWFPLAGLGVGEVCSQVLWHSGLEKGGTLAPTHLGRKGRGLAAHFPSSGAGGGGPVLDALPPRGAQWPPTLHSLRVPGHCGDLEEPACGGLGRTRGAFTCLPLLHT